MTPTEQDDELRKAVWASLATQMTHAINCTDPEHKRQDSCVDFTEKNFEQLMQLITADRKRVAVEARLDEHKRLSEITSMSINPKSAEITKASFMLNVNDWQKYRLDELTKELEK